MAESSTHPIPLSREKTLCLFQQLRVDLGLGLAEEVGGVGVRLEDTVESVASEDLRRSTPCSEPAGATE